MNLTQLSNNSDSLGLCPSKKKEIVTVCNNVLLKQEIVTVCVYVLEKQVSHGS